MSRSGFLALACADTNRRKSGPQLCANGALSVVVVGAGRVDWRNPSDGQKHQLWLFEVEFPEFPVKLLCWRLIKINKLTNEKQAAFSHF